MHDNGRGFTHRDVKPHNVLLGGGGGCSGDDPDHAVLTDLGSVAAARVEVATRQQALAAEDEAACKTSAAYRAPELTSVPQPPCVLDETVDIWGLGCSLYCLAFGHSPFESTREGVLRLAILNGRFSYPPHYRHRDCQFSEAFVGLVSDMLQLAPRDRPSAADVAERCQRMLQS
jgi:serine/threonine kinase 16